MELLIIIILLAAVLFGEQLLYARFGASHVTYRCYFTDDHCTEGDTVELVEEIENRKLLPMPWLKAELTLPMQLDVVNGNTVVTDMSRIVTGFFMIKGASRIQRVRKIRCNGRGIFGVEQVTLLSSDILGIVKFSLPMRDTGQTLTVYPKSTPCPEILLQMQHWQYAEQQKRNGLLTDPFFADRIQPYSDSEPFQRIHWAATAKAQTLMVRKPPYTAQKPLLVLLNLQTVADGNGILQVEREVAEHTIRLCLYCLELAAQMGYLVQFCTNAQDADGICYMLPMQANGLLQQRELLAAIQLRQQMPFRTFLRHYGTVPPDTTALLITAYTDPVCQQWKRQTGDCRILVSASGRDAERLADWVQPEEEAVS